MSEKDNAFQKAFEQAKTKFDPELFEPDETGTKVCFYIGFDQNVSKFDSPIFHVRNQEGDFILWGSCQLARAFKDIPLCSLLQVTYEGEEKISGSGYRMKNYDVKFLRPEKLKAVQTELTKLGLTTNMIEHVIKKDETEFEGSAEFI